MFSRKWAVLVCVAALTLCLGAKQKQAGPETSKELAYYTYTEEVGRVQVIVGSYVTGLEGMKEEFEFLPFQIAIAVHGKGPELDITIENFELHDELGNVYQAATPKQIDSQGPLLQSSKGFDKTESLNIGEQFTNFQPVVSNFYPLTGEGFTGLHLDRETFFKDMVYFPRPKTGLDGMLMFSFYAQGMEEGAVNVKLKVAPLKKKHRKQAEKKRDNTAS